MGRELTYLLLLGVATLVTFLVGARVKRKGDERADGWQDLAQTPSDRPEASLVQVRVPPDGPVNLGSSQESGTPSGSPELLSGDSVLQIEGGPSVWLRAGVPIKIHGLPGAKRTLIDTTTTGAGGVMQRYSFEVSPGSSFWILGVLGDRKTAGPFRSRDLFEIRPFDGCYEACGELPKYRFGTGLSIVVATGALCSCLAVPACAVDPLTCRIAALWGPWVAVALCWIGPRRPSPISQRRSWTPLAWIC